MADVVPFLPQGALREVLSLVFKMADVVPVLPQGALSSHHALNKMAPRVRSRLTTNNFGFDAW